MSEAYIGEIRLFAGNYAPENWALCNGRLLNIAEYSALFVVLGTTYGGDGVVQFALPDLQGRLAVGQGQAPGGTNRVMGQQIGAEDVTLNISQLPGHTHQFSVAGAASTGKPQQQVPAAVTGFNLYAPSSAATAATLGPSSVQIVGGGQPHNNVMPSLVLSHIICLIGNFPSIS
ncbi:MAG: tail fiber protein [Delftia acidovorans]|jgi:microcystin-dependent protein|nr:tail fiber protein [Delftia acidovorans]